MLSYLTITLPAAEKLKMRANFYECAKTEIELREPKNAAALLQGLFKYKTG